MPFKTYVNIISLAVLQRRIRVFLRQYLVLSTLGLASGLIYYSQIVPLAVLILIIGGIVRVVIGRGYRQLYRRQRIVQRYQRRSQLLSKSFKEIRQTRRIVSLYSLRSATLLTTTFYAISSATLREFRALYLVQSLLVYRQSRQRIPLFRYLSNI